MPTADYRKAGGKAPFAGFNVPTHLYITVNKEGFIEQDITLNDENGASCEGGKHTLTLYAVWKPIPRVRDYTLKFNGNGGAPVPGDIVQEETFDGESWKGSTFTMPTDVPVNQQFMFVVGWRARMPP